MPLFERVQQSLRLIWLSVPEFFFQKQFVSYSGVEEIQALENVIDNAKPMTITGAINKTVILLGIVVFTAMYTWNLCAQGFLDKANMLLIGGSVAGLILAIIASFNPKSSPITAPAYAVCEGLVIVRHLGLFLIYCSDNYIP